MPLTLEELKSDAVKYWPQSIMEEVVKINPVPLLLETQDKFISILKCADRTPLSWQNILETSSELPPNLFLKHLMVLADVGGEKLQRYSKDLNNLFPTGKFKFGWRGNFYTYKFKKKSPDWKNGNLKVDKASLIKPWSLTSEMIDVIMLLLWGSSIVENSNLPVEIIERCTIGQYIGLPEELEDFVKTRYICVSRITGGSTANDCGHICEAFCKKRLRDLLPQYYKMDCHNIEGITQNDKDLTTFDLVVENTRTGKCCAIEISFQVTTNSVIERKASLAQNRQELLHDASHLVAYIIDGAGNFQRGNAVQTILNFSDCSVNFSDRGIEKLSRFIQKNC